jgi:hypothetical protein
MTRHLTLLPLLILSITQPPRAFAQAPKFDMLRIRQQYFCPEAKPCVLLFRDTRTIRILPSSNSVIAYRIEVAVRTNGVIGVETYIVPRADRKFGFFGDFAAIVDSPSPGTFFDLPLSPEADIQTVTVTALGPIGEPTRQDEPERAAGAN